MLRLADAVIFLAAAAAAVVVWALLKGPGDAPSWRLVIAWVAGVVAVHCLAVLAILAAYVEWDDPSSSSRLGPLGEPIVAIAAMCLSAVFALFLRRKAVLGLALASLPLMAWYWAPAF